MSIAKGRRVKSSTPRRVDMRVISKTSPKQARPVSTEKAAEQFCVEMIQNLKCNVPEIKHRLD